MPPGRVQTSHAAENDEDRSELVEQENRQNPPSPDSRLYASGIEFTYAHDPIFQRARLEPFLDQADDALIAGSGVPGTEEPFLAHAVKGRPDVGVEDEVHLPALECDHERIKCIVRPPAGPEPVAEPEEASLVDGIQHRR